MPRSKDGDIPLDELWARFEPDFNAGVLRWRGSGKGRRRKIAGYCRPDGYTTLRLKIGGVFRGVLVHRALLAMKNGRWPPDEVDHRGRDPSNNADIREATRMQNAWNLPSFRGSSSQFVGVGWHKQRGKWRASICARGERYHLGLFKTELDASAAYQEAKARLHV